MSIIPTSNVLKDDFDWEIPVETVPLPSEGVVYSPDSVLYNRKTVDITAMTAKEEDILTSAALIKKGETINHLIKSCVTDKTINPNELLLGDRNALMVSIRITGYGQEYKSSIKCPHCNHLNKRTIDLANLPLQFLKLTPVDKGSNEFEYVLPVTKKKVLFKFLTVGDEKERSSIREKMNKHFDMHAETNVTSMLEQAIQGVDGIRDKNKIKHFIQYMPAYDSKSLRTFIQQNEPGINMEYDLVCDDCQGDSPVSVPITSEFFWPEF